MTSPRARWLAARTRNAARHGLIIAGVGTIVMIASLLAFVLLPRQADRALTAAIAAMPVLSDTLRLRADSARLDSLRLRALSQQRDAMQLLAAATAPDSLADSTMAPLVLRDSLLRDLWRQLARARSAPLVESYRALADAPALQRDPAMQRTVRALRDSIERLNTERETYATLSGPDALYAIMTTRLTRLGTTLIRVAQSALPPIPTAVIPPDSTVAAASSTPFMPRALLPDSLLEAMVRVTTDSALLATQALTNARRNNDSLEANKVALRARMQLNIPPLAMLLASLVLGLTSGFVAALWREIRRPTVGDAQELEQLTRSRVIVHTRDESRRFRRRTTRRGEVSVPALSPNDDAWPLLHLTLSHIGDMSRQVQLLADQPLVAGAVGLNLASVAARESRATIVVDAALRAGAVVPLLPLSSLSTATGGHPVPVAAHEQWDSSRALPLGRDANVDLLFPRGVRAASTRHGHSDHPDAASASCTTAADHVRHYDFVVFVTDTLAASAVPPATDVVLCARLGVTPLSWIARAVRMADEQSRRVRAVVLWADSLPLAG